MATGKPRGAPPRKTLTAKQTAFFQRWLTNGQNVSEAYRFAYNTQSSDSVVFKEGRKLLDHPLISPQVAALRAQGQKVTEAAIAAVAVTKEWLVAELSMAFQEARAAKNSAGVARLGELMARMHGMIIERKDVRRVTAWADLSDEELQILAQSAPLTGDGKGKTTKH